MSTGRGWGWSGWSTLASILVASAIVACGGSGGDGDVGPSDTGTEDTGGFDSGAPDAATPDTGVVDAGDLDTGVFDGGDSGDPCTSLDCSSLDDDCTAGACVDGSCEAQPRAAGTACGDGTGDECTAADSCDGAGLCAANDTASGVACGDTGVVCLVDDTCDGSGACTDNGFEPAATTCGDATDDACTNPDSCDGAGSCAANHEPSGTVCADAGVVCVEEDTCSTAGTCVDNGTSSVGTSCGTGPGMACDVSQNCVAPASCAQLLARTPGLASGPYLIDLDGPGGAAPITASCDMTTDGGGWTLVFHVFDLGGTPGGLSEDDFQTTFGHNLFTRESWNWTAAGGFTTAPVGVQQLSTQGAISSATLDGLWTDLRMTCSQTDSDATESNFIQIDGYVGLNGNTNLHGGAANGTSYTVPAASNSFAQGTIWHDNETTSGNSGHYLCDTWTGGTSGAQFGFCYTDHLSNPNTLDFGDSIVSIAFGTQSGADGWSVGFTGECGDMGMTAQQNAGTYSIWVR